jgi:putative ABC transport system ATP-binding protein
MKYLTVESLTKSYKVGNTDQTVIKAMDLEIEKGSFVSIMGPSGSGKSTLLYLLGGLESPSQGAVYLKNQDISHLKEKQMSKIRRRTLGFVFQFYNLVPNLSVEDNILLPIALDKKPIHNYKDKLDMLLKLVGLEDKRDHLPSQLSGGQQQRVAIARALIIEPDLLLLDEPVGNLDSKAAHEVMHLFKSIHEKMNITIIQVTHSQEFALFGDRIVHIIDGRICSDTKEELKKSIKTIS